MERDKINRKRLTHLDEEVRLGPLGVGVLLGRKHPRVRSEAEHSVEFHTALVVLRNRLAEVGEQRGDQFPLLVESHTQLGIYRPKRRTTSLIAEDDIDEPGQPYVA